MKKDQRKKALTRDQYKKIKSMDHTSMNAWVQSFADRIYREGRASVPGIDIKVVREVLLSVKGIGAKRTEEAMRLLEERIKEASE